MAKVYITEFARAGRDDSDQDPFAALDRLGLQIVRMPLP